MLGILERVSRFSGVQPLSYALLDNHVHLLLKVPERRSVPEAEFRRRVEALYGAARSGKLFAKWDKWRDEGRDGDIAFERDGLQKRMFDLGQFVKTAKEFEAWMAEAEGIQREKVKEALARGEGLSLAEMLVCRVHAFGNGRAIGTERAMRSVPRSGDAVAVPQCRAGLFTATRLSGCLYRVA